MTSWHYMRKGLVRDEQIGPVDTNTLADRIRAGTIGPDTPICSAEKTHGRWVPMRTFEPLLRIHAEGEQARQQQVDREREAKAEAKRAERESRALARADSARAKLARARAQSQRVPKLLPAEVPAERYAAPAAPAPVQYLQAPAPGASIVNVTVNTPRSSNAGAVLLSFLFPGLGQLSQGRVFAGLFWMSAAVVSGLLCILLIGFLIAPFVILGSMIDAGMYRG